MRCDPPLLHALLAPYPQTQPMPVVCSFLLSSPFVMLLCFCLWFHRRVAILTHLSHTVCVVLFACLRLAKLVGQPVLFCSATSPWITVDFSWQIEMDDRETRNQQAGRPCPLCQPPRPHLSWSSALCFFSRRWIRPPSRAISGSTGFPHTLLTHFLALALALEPSLHLPSTNY